METELARARLEEILATIESTASVLRASLQRAPAETETLEARAATGLGLPFHATREVADQAALLRVAAERLTHLVTPPRHVVFEAAGSFYVSLALHFSVQHDLATFLEDNQPPGAAEEGVPLDALAEKAQLDVTILSRLVRHLTGFGIFQEPSPGRFANTVASKTMVRAPEFCAHLDLVMYEGMKALPHWPEFLHQRFAGSTSSAPSLASPFTLFSGGVPLYEWMHTVAPERGRNFAVAMHGAGQLEGLDFLPAEYPFADLAPETLLVDVGGALGSVPSLVLPHAPHLKFVVQDLAPVVKQAEEAAQEGTPMRRWMDEGRVRFEAHDCFAPQPEASHGAVFVLKSMLHNHPDDRALQMLTHVRAAAPAKLLVIDRVIHPHLLTQASTAAAEQELYNALRSESGNGIRSQRAETMYDVIMAALPGGRTRTLEDWTALLERGGFKLDRVWRLRASTGQAVLEASPFEIPRPVDP